MAEETIVVSKITNELAYRWLAVLAITTLIAALAWASVESFLMDRNDPIRAFIAGIFVGTCLASAIIDPRLSIRWIKVACVSGLLSAIIWTFIEYVIYMTGNLNRVLLISALIGGAVATGQMMLDRRYDRAMHGLPDVDDEEAPPVKAAPRAARKRKARRK